MDPTRTKTLRGDFASASNKRFRSLKGDICEALVDLDVLHLGSQLALNQAPNPRDYQFLSDAEKRQRFQAWLREQIDSGVLEPTSDAAVRRGDHWTAQYVRRAYAKGVTDAGATLRQSGVDVEQLEDVFNQPIHASKIELIYTRTFDGLEGITQEMDTQISRELSNAIAEGWNPRKAASKLSDRVDAIGMTRAQPLSQTEIIHAYAAEETLEDVESQLLTLTHDIDTVQTWMFGREEDVTNAGVAAEITENKNQLKQVIDALHDEESLEFNRDDIDE